MGTKDLCANIRHDLIQAFEDLQCCTERKADHNDVLNFCVHYQSGSTHELISHILSGHFIWVCAETGLMHLFSEKTFDSSVKKREPGPKDQTRENQFLPWRTKDKISKRLY